MSTAKTHTIKQIKMTSSEKNTLFAEAKNVSLLLNTLLPLEVSNIYHDASPKRTQRIVRCGLWLTRLCHASGVLSWRLHFKKIIRTEYNVGEESLYNLLVTEMEQELKLAKDGKYNKKLLQYITKGTQYVNNWFQV